LDCFIQYFLKNKIKIVDTNYLSGILVIVKKTLYNQINNKRGDKTIKKVLLTSVAALAVFSAVAPVFAQGENPNASNQLIQKKYVSERDIADQANAYADSHTAEIAEMVEKEPAVIAARAELAKAEAIIGHNHEKAVAAAKREGAEVLGVVAIFSYQLPKADKNFSDAGVKLVTLSNYSELIHLAQEEGYITPEGLDLLKRFKEDQENWQNA